jgi:hypothetical protein
MVCKGSMVGIVDILIYNIATLNYMCLLHDKPRRKMRFEKKQELWWVSRDYITIMKIVVKD